MLEEMIAKEHQARTHNQAQFEFLTVNRFSYLRYADFAGGTA